MRIGITIADDRQSAVVAHAGGVLNVRLIRDGFMAGYFRAEGSDVGCESLAQALSEAIDTLLGEVA